MSRIYTLEAYAPATPDSGRFVRILHGDFEYNRDRLSPSMIDTREIIVNKRIQAVEHAKNWIRQLNLNHKLKMKYKFKR